MGQGQSTDSKRNEDVSMYPEDIQQTHHKIVALRSKLAALKAEGKANKKKRKKEMKVLSKEKMDLHVTLMKLGKHAQRHFSFWEYVRIIRSTFNTTAAAPAIEGSTKTLNKNSNKRVPKTREMVKQSDAVQYTIFAFYEAYLLKKLHVAMMLKTQKKLHAKGWNDMVMFLYNEIPKIQTSFEKAEAKIVLAQSEEDLHKTHVEEAYKKHIENQNMLMAALQDAVEGKVRTAPEGTLYSFRKKKNDTSAGSSRSLKDTVGSSSRSVESEDSSGSIKKKEIRPSMFGPAYESGSIKKEVYQAPWQKNSRSKIAKVVQKTQTPEEKAEEDAKNVAIAPAPFSRKAKFQSKFSKFQTPKEDEEEEEEEKLVVKKDSEPETEHEPEPVKEDEVGINDEKSPDETEATDKLTEAGEETKKKKKKKKLPAGMPETLEITTNSGDEEELDGEGQPIKKKKKKKKKKVAADGAATVDSEDEDLEDSERVVTKKKKKKKKAGESSNSSVVSELSNGSHLPH